MWYTRFIIRVGWRETGRNMGLEEWRDRRINVKETPKMGIVHYIGVLVDQVLSIVAFSAHSAPAAKIPFNCFVIQCVLV